VLELVASIRDSPMTAAFGCAAIIPIAVWSVAVVGWMIMGEMDFLFGLVALICAFLLGMVVMMPSEPIFAPIAFCGILLLMIVFPVVRRQLDRRALVAIEVEQIEGAYQMLSERPDNASAMFNLAERLYYRGLVSHAIGIGELALAKMPQSLFPEENRAIQKWRHAAKSHGVARDLPCLQCGHRNGPAVLHCESCGSDYLALYARGKWLGSTLAMRLVAAWVAAMVALVGLPLTVSAIKELPMVIALSLIQVAIAGLLLWRAFVYKGALT
jgi:hypothetical protein